MNTTKMRKLGKNQTLVLQAIDKGIDISDIPEATGLTKQQVQNCMGSLIMRGLINLTTTKDATELLEEAIVEQANKMKDTIVEGVKKDIEEYGVHEGIEYLMEKGIIYNHEDKNTMYQFKVSETNDHLKRIMSTVVEELLSGIHDAAYSLNFEARDADCLIDMDCFKEIQGIIWEAVEKELTVQYSPEVIAMREEQAKYWREEQERQRQQHEEEQRQKEEKAKEYYDKYKSSFNSSDWSSYDFGLGANGVNSVNIDSIATEMGTTSKKLYRQMASKLHTDKGGSHELMIFVNKIFNK